MKTISLDPLKVPSFIVVYGEVLCRIGGFAQKLRVDGDSVFYKKHGEFSLEHSRDTYGIIHHVTLSGEEKKIFIPPEKLMLISNGRWSAIDVNHVSFLSHPVMIRPRGYHSKRLRRREAMRETRAYTSGDLQAIIACAQPVKIEVWNGKMRFVTCDFVTAAGIEPDLKTKEECFTANEVEHHVRALLDCGYAFTMKTSEGLMRCSIE